MAMGGALFPSVLKHLSSTIRRSQASLAEQMLKSIMFPSLPCFMQSVNSFGGSAGKSPCGAFPVTVIDGVLVVGVVGGSLTPGGVALSTGGLPGD
jgi:hypothetical protein